MKTIVVRNTKRNIITIININIIYFRNKLNLRNIFKFIAKNIKHFV